MSVSLLDRITRALGAMGRAPARRRLRRAEAAYAARRFHRALLHWRAADAADIPEGAFRIGQLYARGEGVQRNLPEAACWLRRAADQGHAEAQLRLAQILLNGARGGPVARWRDSAAERDARATRGNEAALFPQGLEVAANVEEALGWLEAAETAGSIEAEGLLGAMRLDGAAGIRDVAEGLRRLTRAAEAGVAQAQFRLGDVAFQGLGGVVDACLAADWYEQAAAQKGPHRR